MIPVIGLIISVYALGRFIQIPIESMHVLSWRWIPIAVVSAVASAIIAVLAFALVSVGMQS